MCREAQITVSNSYEECEEMSLTKESKGTKPKHPQNNPNTPKTTMVLQQLLQVFTRQVLSCLDPNVTQKSSII